ncbi:ATP-binding protein [Deltaproteobacteria bacterium TL4]
MRGKRLIWQLYPSYLFIILLTILPFSWYVAHSFREFDLVQIKNDLLARATFIEYQISRESLFHNKVAINALCQELGRRTATRITTILPSGEVLGDSDEIASHMENHANRPEIQEAFKGLIGSTIRYSDTLQKPMMYVAISSKKENQLMGVVRVSIPLTRIDTALGGIFPEFLLGGLVTILLVTIFSFWISRSISRPLEEMKQGAELFAQGDLKHWLKIPEVEEMKSLAQTLNQMATLLDDRINTISQQHNEQEAVFSSMVESVLALDPHERLIKINHAAAQLFGISENAIVGRYLQEVIRNVDLQDFAKTVLQSHLPVEGEVVIHKEEEIHLQAQGTVLRSAEQQNIGALIVLNDVTRIRQLENMRKDFVSNVSHELKTPITSIKGAVEALIDDALNHPAEAKRFVDIIDRHTDRLIAIIEDLLNLSRFEKSEDLSNILFAQVDLRELLQKAIQECSVNAAEKGIEIQMECNPALRVCVAPSIFESAIINLIDNAVKYSQTRSPILVSAVANDLEFSVHVRDQGCGIAKEHLDRLFERFYRVDKSRSRKIGGTGLGLSIVKHIAQIHGGRVSVQSATGKGSTFSVHLPLIPPNYNHS